MILLMGFNSVNKIRNDDRVSLNGRRKSTGVNRLPLSHLVEIQMRVYTVHIIIYIQRVSQLHNNNNHIKANGWTGERKKHNIH